MLLTLMRHGLPVRDDGNRMDPGLSEEGYAQVRAVGPYARAKGFDVVYTSPQRRAAQTADVVAAALDLPVVVDAGLVEFDHGAAYVHYDSPDVELWQRYRAGDLSPWGLTGEEFHGRIAATMERLSSAHAGQRVLAVCHGGVVNAWTCQVLGVPDRLLLFEPGYASMHHFIYSGGKWELLGLNEVAHDLPRQFT
ncbi:histidine phosphatase family protein [Nocardia brevicatena]|uniref:histidine phosphatase family protein n=1 Tax=Nocardia brevicatena TaxID=37327 RepID=UPI0002DDBF86|nr:histidine phosphatase family protein [Nocardia brevicatena]